MGHSCREDRFLVLAPTGRDAALTCAILERARMSAAPFPDIQSLCGAWDESGALGLMISEEALTASARHMVRERLAVQPPWSDIPVLIFRCAPGQQSMRPLNAQVLRELGNVTLLDRPLHQLTMLSAANAASRTRRRQYAARTALEEQQLAVRQRDQFLAMLGHELRNPLAAISLASQADAEFDQALGVVRRQVKHLTRMVDDLLDVSRVTSGKIALQRSALELGKVVTGAVETVRSAHGARRLALTVELPDEPAYVHADAVRLEQVVVNVLGNAAKYTPDGGHIAVRVACDAAEVRLSVCDDGVGIAPEMLPHVFDLFAQAQGSLDRAQGGMGIGLTLVRSLLRLHGGTIEAHSAGLGHGSTFTIHLPRLAPERVAELKAASHVGIVRATPPAESRRVLVVEDNDDSRELLSALLRRRGHRVSTAIDGLHGIEVATRERPEVVLVDIGLPGIDGYQVAERLRSELGTAPYLVALTGYGQPEDRSRARQAGFDIHLTKPVDVGTLQRIISSRERTL